MDLKCGPDIGDTETALQPSSKRPCIPLRPVILTRHQRYLSSGCNRHLRLLFSRLHVKGVPPFQLTNRRCRYCGESEPQREPVHLVALHAEPCCACCHVVKFQVGPMWRFTPVRCWLSGRSRGDIGTRSCQVFPSSFHQCSWHRYRQLGGTCLDEELFGHFGAKNSSIWTTPPDKELQPETLRCTGYTQALVIQ